MNNRIREQGTCKRRRNFFWMHVRAAPFSMQGDFCLKQLNEALRWCVWASSNSGHKQSVCSETCFGLQYRLYARRHDNNFWSHRRDFDHPKGSVIRRSTSQEKDWSYRLECLVEARRRARKRQSWCCMGICGQHCSWYVFKTLYHSGWLQYTRRFIRVARIGDRASNRMINRLSESLPQPGIRDRAAYGLTRQRAIDESSASPKTLPTL